VDCERRAGLCLGEKKSPSKGRLPTATIGKEGGLKEVLGETQAPLDYTNALKKGEVFSEPTGKEDRGSFALETEKSHLRKKNSLRSEVGICRRGGKHTRKKGDHSLGERGPGSEGVRRKCWLPVKGWAYGGEEHLGENRERQEAVGAAARNALGKRNPKGKPINDSLHKIQEEKSDVSQGKYS